MNASRKTKVDKVAVAPVQRRVDRQIEGQDCQVGMAPPPIVMQQADAGSSLPKRLVQGFWAEMGQDLSQVKVHYNSEEPRKVQAAAFARGEEIFVAPGQEGHLAHEAGHVVQQRLGKVAANKVVGGQAVNDAPELEQEATEMGEKALASRPGSALPKRMAGSQRATNARVAQREPIRRQAGTAQEFIAVFNNTPSRMGTRTGTEAHNAMLRLGETQFDWGQMRPLPTTTPYFNNRPARYVYTTRGGWIDMVHFLFYAGRAYKYKVERAEAQRTREAAEERMRETYQNSPGYWPPVYPPSRAERMDPIGEAVQDGFSQERSDRLMARHSAYSYEDLPSNTFGARFAVQFFNAASNLSLGEQVLNYLVSELGATTPESAPNFDSLPENEPTDSPTRTNYTTRPVYVEGNP